MMGNGPYPTSRSVNLETDMNCKNSYLLPHPEASYLVCSKINDTMKGMKNMKGEFIVKRLKEGLKSFVL